METVLQLRRRAWVRRPTYPTGKAASVFQFHILPDNPAAVGRHKFCKTLAICGGRCGGAFAQRAPERCRVKTAKVGRKIDRGAIVGPDCAGVATAYHLLTRFLAGSENTMALLFQTALVGSVFFCVAAVGSLGRVHIAAIDLAWMGVLGVLATTGHFLFTAAYREAPASLLAPVNYLTLVWGAVLGVIVFAHWPDAISLCGMALVCASGVVIALGAKRA